MSEITHQISPKSNSAGIDETPLRSWYSIVLDETKNKEASVKYPKTVTTRLKDSQKIKVWREKVFAKNEVIPKHSI